MTDRHFWLGGYTATLNGTAEGIGLARVRDADGVLEYVDVAAETSSPSFLVRGVAPEILYAADEGNGRVEAFRVDGLALTSLGGRAVSGQFPCHLSATAERLYVSNYGDGSVDVFGLEPNGEIGELLQSLHGSGSGPRPEQAGPHAHSTIVSAPGDVVLSADLGSDNIHSYRVTDVGLDRTGSTHLPPGTGPRDFARRGDVTYAVGELDGGLFALDTHGAVLGSGAVVADWTDGDHAAALALDASGQFLYTGLRGSNRIAVAKASDLSPVVTVDCGGDWPRHLAIDGDLLYVANQLSGSIASFRIDPESGIPRHVGDSGPAPSPTYLLASE